MKNGNEPVDLPILFTEPSPPPANFAVWPRDTNSPFKAVLNGQLISIAEAPEAALKSDLNLRQSLGGVSEFLGNRYPRLHEHINNLYYWRYKQVFKTLRVLKLLVSEGRISTLSFPTSRGPKRRFVLNRGDEGPAIWVKPENEFPFYAAAIGSQYIKVSSPKNSLGGHLLMFRPWLLFIIRLAMSVAGVLAQKTKTLIGALPRRTTRNVPVHSIAIARSWSQAERFSRIATELGRLNVTVGILVDLTLFQALQRTPTWVRTTDNILIPSSKYFRFYDVIAAVKNSVANALRTPAQILFHLTDGTNNIEEDFGPINLELELSHIDHELHLRRLDSALKALSPVSVISGESISPYIFSHGMAAKKNGMRIIRMQQVGVSAEDFVRTGHVDHLIFQDPDLARAMKNMFPEQAETFEYLGEPNFVLDRKRSKFENSNSDRQFSLTFFTQPLDAAGNLSVARSILDVFKEKIEKSEFVFNIKLHPRDTTKYDDLPFVKFISKQESSTEVLEKTDFAISRSSSVLQDALAMGVPFLGVRLSPIDQDLVAPYFDDRLNGYVSSISSFTIVLKNLDEYIDGFTQRRRAFVTQMYQPFAWKRLSSLCADKFTD
jgi:hypothetical protein